MSTTTLPTNDVDSALFTFGDVNLTAAELRDLISFTNSTHGEPDTAEDHAVYVDVYQQEPSIFLEDLAAYRAAKATPAPSPAPIDTTCTVESITVSATSSAKADTNATAAPSAPPVSTPADNLAEHERDVAEIVALITDKLLSDGERNLQIGQRIFKRARRQRESLSGGYKVHDHDRLMMRIREEVRYFVPIKPDSIKCFDWLRAYVLREEIRKDAGDDTANALAYYDLDRLVAADALKYDKPTVDGVLREGWIDIIRQAAIERINGTMDSKDFTDKCNANRKRLEELRNPSKAKAADDPIAVSAKAKADATVKAAKLIGDSIAAGSLTPDELSGIVERSAKHHKAPITPKSGGFNPETCTVSECDQLAVAMFQAGKYAEMVALHSRIGKMIAAADAQRNRRPATLSLPKAKIA